MADINLRISELRDKLFGGSNSEFARQIGMSEANIRGYASNIEPKYRFFAKCYERIPRLNMDWLLNGKGEMLRNEQIFDTPSSIDSLEAKISNEQDNGHLKQALNDTHSLIECEQKLRQKEEEIMELRLRITQIQEDLLKSQQQFINHLLAKK